MKELIRASETLLDLGSKHAGVTLAPIIRQYAVTLISKYFADIPEFNFGLRLASCTQPGEFRELADDALMYGSFFQSYTSTKLGAGGVRYVQNVSQMSYQSAGLKEIVVDFVPICTVLSGINARDDVGQLILFAQAGDQSSRDKLQQMGVFLLH